MNTAHYTTSTDQLLNGLVRAIDEARLVISLITSKNMATEIKENNPYSDKLISLNREIMYLEAKLNQVRGQTKDQGNRVFA